MRDIVLAFEVDTPIDILRMALSDAMQFRTQIIESIQAENGAMYYNVPTPDVITFEDLKTALSGRLTPEQLHSLFDGLE